MPTPANLEQAQKLNARIKVQIEAGTFVFSDVFPEFRGLGKLPGSVSAKSCGEVFIYNNVISALRRAFAFGYLDYPDRADPATRLRSAKMGKKDRPRIDPFSIQDAEVFIAALNLEWGEAHGNYEEFRFFTGLRPSVEIALTVSDYDRVNGTLSVTKARVMGSTKIAPKRARIVGSKSVHGRSRSSSDNCKCEPG
jgi:integrase